MFKLVLLISMLLTGCATIVSGPIKPVYVRSIPNDINFTIRDENGKTLFTGKTPIIVQLPTSDGYFDGATHSISFYDEQNNKIGYSTIDSDINGWYFGNLIFGGIIVGMLIVDPLTGSMWTLPRESVTVLDK